MQQISLLSPDMIVDHQYYYSSSKSRRIILPLRSNTNPINKSYTSLSSNRIYAFISIIDHLFIKSKIVVDCLKLYA